MNLGADFAPAINNAKSSLPRLAVYPAVSLLIELFLLNAVRKLDPNADYSQMKVGQLKQLLKDRGVDIRDCIEKPDFISKIQQLAAAA